MVPFIRDGLEAGEPVMAAVTRQHEDWLQDALDGQADHVQFVNMLELGRNPAQLIPAWQQFLDNRSERSSRTGGRGADLARAAPRGDS